MFFHFKAPFENPENLVNLPRPGNSLWPFREGENVTRFKWWIVTSNDRGWKGHGLNHLVGFFQLYMSRAAILKR